jgi:polyisoprenoid-binding protein YceI
MKSILFFAFIVFFGMGTVQSFAQGIVTFGPRETEIDGSIPYSVIGFYKARFNVFKGRITLDEKLQRIQSVYLEIEAGSIQSNFSWCDRIARSRRLLSTAKYPKIIFKSDKITQDDSGYKVEGVLEMHGIKRRMTFPFSGKIIHDRENKWKQLDLKGRWIINRKDFNIIWSKLLDRGGIVVGDHLTVDWGIKVYLK